MITALALVLHQSLQKSARARAVESWAAAAKPAAEAACRETVLAAFAAEPNIVALAGSPERVPAVVTDMWEANVFSTE